MIRWAHRMWTDMYCIQSTSNPKCDSTRAAQSQSSASAIRASAWHTNNYRLLAEKVGMPIAAEAVHKYFAQQAEISKRTTLTTLARKASYVALPKQQLHEMLRRMLRIRVFDERAAVLSLKVSIARFFARLHSRRRRRSSGQHGVR